MNNTSEIIWVWLHCYIALENNDNKNEGFGTSPRKFIVFQKLQWNTSIYACCTSTGSSLQLACWQVKGITLQTTEYEVMSFTISDPIFSFRCLYFFLYIKLQHKQAIQERNQGGTETGHGHTQVFQDGLSLHRVWHSILQHRDVYPLTNCLLITHTLLLPHASLPRSWLTIKGLPQPS